MTNPPRPPRSKARLLAAGSAALYVGLALGASACKKDVAIEELVDYTLPNDTHFLDMWGLRKIDAVPAWQTTTDCSSKIVAVIDTGVDYDHPDLKDNLWKDSSGKYGQKYLNGSNSTDPKDDNLHGTHVAGTIGALGNNGVGTTGICWKAQIMTIKVLDSSGSGLNSDLALGLQYAITNGAKVVNMSLGGAQYSATVDAKVVAANTAGIVLIVAAGNEGRNNDSSPSYPASYGSANVVSVGATDENDALASFSNYGTTNVKIAAPGSKILSTMPTYTTSDMSALGKATDYDKLDGTSMAAPHVAGAVTLLWANHPTLSHTEVIDLLYSKATAISSLDGKVASGRRMKMGASY